jgi:hypothetical protein
MKPARLLFFFLIISLPARSQEDKNEFRSVAFMGHYGFIIPHSRHIRHLSDTWPFGIELSVGNLRTTAESWKVFNSYWNRGIILGYFNFRNPDITGGAYMLTGYVEPYIIRGEKLNFTIRGGAGLSYHTRIYDSIDNSENKFFATRINFPVYVAARLNYELRPGVFLNIAANYNHISNGGIRQPNLGMNFPTISAGLQYYTSGSPELLQRYDSDEHIETGISLFAQFLTGYRVVDESPPYPEKGTLAYGFHLRAAKQLTKFYSLNAGGEIIFDGAIKERIRREGQSTDYKRMAVTAGQEFLFGRAAFTQYFGFYIYSPYKAFRNIYQKYELSFRMTPEISAGAFLKAHLYVAELMGFQINYKW